MNFQGDISSIPMDNFKDHYLLVFDLTSMQDSTENCHYRELVGEPLKLELNFTFPLEHVTELTVMGERMSSDVIDKFGVLGKKIPKMNIVSLRQIFNRIPLLKYRYRGLFPSNCVPILLNEAFAIINMQPSNMQSEHWIMNANSCHKLFFADFFGRPSFVMQQ